MKYFVENFSFSVLKSLIFVIYFVEFVISTTTHTQIIRQNIEGLSSSNLYTLPPPLNRLQKRKSMPNT